MERRKFLKFTAGGLVVGAFTSFMVLNRDTKKAAVDFIFRDLDFLNLDRKGVEAFVEDYMGDNKGNAFLQLKIKVADVFNISQYTFDYRMYLVRNFLLSSTFFQNKMDERKLVTYSGNLYNPFKTPCSNPFSHFHFPNPPDMLTQEPAL